MESFTHFKFIYQQKTKVVLQFNIHTTSIFQMFSVYQLQSKLSMFEMQKNCMSRKFSCYKFS